MSQQQSAESDSNGTEYPEIKSPETRAQEKVEEMGGLPDDNPFSDIVEDLRSQGLSWKAVYDKLNSVFDVVDQATHEEMMIMAPEWEVTYDEFPHTEDETADTTRIFADTRDEAINEIGERVHGEVLDAEQIGVGKYS